MHRFRKRLNRLEPDSDPIIAPVVMADYGTEPEDALVPAHSGRPAMTVGEYRTRYPETVLPIIDIVNEKPMGRGDHA